MWSTPPHQRSYQPEDALEVKFFVDLLFQSHIYLLWFQTIFFRFIPWHVLWQKTSCDRCCQTWWKIQVTNKTWRCLNIILLAKFKIRNNHKWRHAIFKFCDVIWMKVQWNAEIRTYKIRKVLKSKLLLVRFSARSDFERSGFKIYKKSVREWNVQFGPKLNHYVQKTNVLFSFWAQLSKIQTIQFHLGLWTFRFRTGKYVQNPNKIVWFSDRCR